jgi:hypothetical protein
LRGFVWLVGRKKNNGWEILSIMQSQIEQFDASNPHELSKIDKFTPHRKNCTIFYYRFSAILTSAQFLYA